MHKTSVYSFNVLISTGEKWQRINNIYTYLLLICIYMECLCFKLEFGHLLPEFEIQRQTSAHRRGKSDHKRREANREKEMERERGTDGGRKRERDRQMEWQKTEK